MTSLENKVLQCASGEKRLNPDELRQYFGLCGTYGPSCSIGKC